MQTVPREASTDMANGLEHTFGPRNWRSPHIGPRQCLYSNGIHDLYRVDVDFGAFSKQYFITEVASRAGIIAARKGSVLLVKHYRLLIDALSWEIPWGAVEEGETPEETALRRCLEETGVNCEEPLPLVSAMADLNTLDAPSHLFYSLQNTGSDQQGTDDISQWVPLSQCMGMISAGRIVDSFSVLAILSYHSLCSGVLLHSRFNNT